MRTLPAMVAAAAGALVTACAPGLPAPVVEGVQPDWGYNGEDTDVTILGQDFYPRVRVSGSSDFEVDRQFQAWLVDDDGLTYALEDVAIATYESLSATVPLGLDPGRYGLLVQGPTEAQAELTSVFEVRDTRADAILAEVEGSTYGIGEQALIELRVVDPDGEVVSLDLSVEVRVTDEDLAGAVVFAEDTLDNQVSLADGTGIRGNLRATGEGFVALTSLEPANLVVGISPADVTSGIADEAVVLAFLPGVVAAVGVQLPREDYIAVAGNDFGVNLVLLDADGFPTEGELAVVTLREDCPGGTFLTDVQVLDSKTVFVQPTAATYADSTTCSSNRLVAITGAVSSASEAFQVLPAEVDHYRLTLSSKAVVAGEDFLVLVQAEDAFGNLVDDHQVPLVLSESVGDDFGDFLGEWDCGGDEPFEGGQAVCTVSLWTARVGTVLTASSEDAEGRSGAMTVLPAEADDLLVEVNLSSGAIIAGEEFLVEVQVLDFYANPVAFSPAGADAPDFSDGSGALSCAPGSSLPDEVESFRCIAELAELEKTIDVSIDSLGLDRRSDVFEVVNAELADVSVTMGPTQVVAGEPVEVDFVATDAFGNPYLSQTDARITLGDLGNSVSPGSVSLDADGLATEALTFTTAMEDDILVVTHVGGGGGSSSPFDVLPGDLDQFLTEIEGSWVWLEDELDVTITAADPYGNAVTEFAGSVNVASNSGLFSAQTLSGFSSGVLDASLSFDDAGLQDTLTLSGGGVSSASGAFDVVDAGCASGPTAALAVGGSAPATLCRTSGVTASTTLSAAGSTKGAASLSAWHFHDGLHDWDRISSSSTSTAWEEEGAFTAQVLVVDSQACGSLATATVYVADDDGEAAGEVEVSLTKSSLVAGSSSLGRTTLDLSATDCSGDPVSGGTLYVRADLGSLSSGTTSLSTTGAGLALTTDSNGEAQVTWSMASVAYAGTATVYAGVQSGAAAGSASATVTGDAAAPTVLWVDPSGTGSETFESVEIVFSESIRSSSVTSSRVSLTDGDGDALPISAATVSGDTLVISLTESQSLSGQDVTLWLSSSIHDQGGTGLDGTYDGTGSDFELTFGDVADDSVDVSSCSVGVSTFRPDGDPGTGSEADQVSITLGAATAPEWWEVVITDADGDEVLVDRQAAVAASGDTWVWGGRDQDGFIVDNGAYTVSFYGLDAAWNSASSCKTKLTVDNLVRLPEGG